MAKDVGVAVMAKLHRIFGSDQRYVAFDPIAPPWSEKQLEFAHANPLTLDDLANWERFAWQVNRIPPVGPVFAAGDAMLWDVWEQFLNQVQVDIPELAPEQKRRQAEAQALLFDPEHPEVPSAKYADYLACEYAYMAAVTNFKNVEVAIHCSSDAEQRAALEASLPALDREMERANERWLAAHKLEIERAIAELAALGTGLTDISGYKHALTLSRRKNGDWFDTRFRPSRLQWATVTLDATEISTLVKEAPSELVEHYSAVRVAEGPNYAVPVVERVSMELALVNVVRPWFRPTLLDLDWTWPLSQDLSDGEGGGLLPGYVTDLLFVRNIDFTLREGGSQPVVLAPGQVVQVGSLTMAVRKVGSQPASLTTVRQPVRMSPADLKVVASAARLAAGAVKPAPAEVKPVSPAAVKPAMTGLGAVRRIDPGVLRKIDLASKPVSPKPSAPAPEPPPPPAPPPEPVVVDGPNDLQLLGYLCRRVPTLPRRR